MKKENRQEAAITPEQSLDSLPELPYSPDRSDEEFDLRRAELLQSVLTITRVDHVSESQMVRDAVSNALDRVPDAGE